MKKALQTTVVLLFAANATYAQAPIDSLIAIGNDFYNGTNGCVQSYYQALDYYTQAAEMGTLEAQYKIGAMYDNDLNMAPDGMLYQQLPQKNDEEALVWYEKAAAGGLTEAQLAMGDYFLFNNSSPNSNKALEWYVKASGNGNITAINNIGIILIQEDKVKAVQMFTTAAGAGLSEAQYNLGLMYFFGVGVTRNSVEARKWFSKATGQGFEKAQKALENLPEEWPTQASNQEEMSEYERNSNTLNQLSEYSKAAHDGDIDAQYHMGVIYDKERNRLEAARWFLLAAEQGDVVSQERYDIDIEQLLSRMCVAKRTSSLFKDVPYVFDSSVFDIDAGFEGGEYGLTQFIIHNINYPKYSKIRGSGKGSVQMRFKVGVDGKISNISIIKGLSPKCNKAAVDVISRLPSYRPARVDGRIVPTWQYIEIPF